MEHVRAGSLHTADTFVPGRVSGPVRPSTGSDRAEAVAAPHGRGGWRAVVADARGALSREVLLGASTTLTALGIVAGGVLSVAPEAEPDPTPVPVAVAVKVGDAGCDDDGRAVAGRVVVHRDGDGTVGVVVGAATVCASGVATPGPR